MEDIYRKLKRNTLKNLVEARGLTASNKTKADLIAAIMELDNATTSNGNVEETEFQREVKSRLALYAPNPAVQIIDKVMADVRTDLDKKMEMERTERMELARMEMAERTKIELAKMEMAERRQEIQRAGEALASSPVPAGVSHKMIQYNAFRQLGEAEEDIDGFLQDFERQCTLHKVEPEDWVQILANKLTGRAADAYRTVSDQDCMDYKRVKEVILARYALTPEAYRQKFRKTTKRETDTHAEWACKLWQSRLQWVQGSKADTKEDVLQLIMLERFFYWVNSRDARMASGLTDEHYDARRAQLSGSKTVSRGPPMGLEAPKPQKLGGGPTNTPAYQSPPGVRCHTCHQLGHLQRHCPNRTQRTQWPKPETTTFNRAAVHCYQDEADPASVAMAETYPVTTRRQARAAEAESHSEEAQKIYLKP
ncbi:uncharacterized protein [Phyllobates terribilis]|uniref:uncharacterized protein n=1 Tax=Phyllobates terribilis TaxID=111132 RepID=UPI003CCA89AF